MSRLSAKQSATDSNPQALSVWLDDPAFGPLTRIGVLSNPRVYPSPFWLKQPMR